MRLKIWIGVALLSTALSASAEKLWIANAGAGTVSVIETEKRNKVSTITLGAGAVPVSVAISPFLPIVCVTDAGRASVWVLSYQGQFAVAEIPVSIAQPFGCAFSVDGLRLYVGNADGGFTEGKISVVDPRHLREIHTIDISAQGLVGIDMAITPVTGERLYVACNGTDNVVGINTANDTLITSPGFPINIPSAPAHPFAIALRPDNAFIYVCEDDRAAAASKLAVIDVPTLTPSIVAMAAGERSAGVYCHPNNRKAYVTTGGAGRVRILNTIANVFVSNVINVPAGAVPAKSAVDGAGRLGVVTDQGNAGAFIFQALADVVQGGNNPTGAIPFGCAIVPITSNRILNIINQRRGGHRGGGRGIL